MGQMTQPCQNTEGSNGRKDQASFPRGPPYHVITSGQSNLTQGRIAATHEWFSRIRQVMPMYILYIGRQKWLPRQSPLVTGYWQHVHFVGKPLKPPPYPIA